MNILSYSSCLFCALVLTGCLCPPVHEKLPTFSLEETWNSSLPSPTADQSASPDNWWEVFQDPQLTALIEEGLSQSPTIEQAFSRFDQALYVAKITGADQFPELSLNGYGSRRRIPKDLRPSAKVPTGNVVSPNIPPSMPTTGISPIIVPVMPEIKKISPPKFVNNLIANLLVTYELDFWGTYYLKTKAAISRMNASKDDLETARLLLADQITSAYFTIQALERQLQVLLEEIDTHKIRISLLTKQCEKGLTDTFLLLNEQSSLELEKAEEHSLISSKDSAYTLLSVLIGRDPNHSSLSIKTTPWSFPIVPTDLPSSLLTKRPDVRSKIKEAEAILSEIGAAKTDFLPSISLSGAAGYQAGVAHEWFKWKDRIWSLAASITQSIFDAGRRSSQVAYTQAKFKEAAANLTQNVLSSVKEVEDALSAINTQTERRKTSLQRTKNFSLTEKLRLDRYMLGMSDYLSFLQAKEITLQSKKELISEELNVQLATVTLIKSIGGSWSLKPTPNEPT